MQSGTRVTNFAIVAALLSVFVSPGAQAQCEQAKLVASDAAREQYFGAAVGISGDVAIVGAAGGFLPGGPGAAYVFRRYGSNWVQQQKLVPSDLQPGSFGWAVAIDGNVAVVTAPSDSDAEPGAGAVYVFQWNGTTWVQLQKLLPNDPVTGGGFGISVAIDGNVTVIGLMGDIVFGKTRPGAVYVFRWNGSNWLQKERLAPSDVGVFDRFGTSVAVSGNVIVSGAPGHPPFGAVYVFRWNGASWVQEQKVTPSDGASPDDFGRSVATYQNVFVSGVPNHDGAFVGSGKAYVYRFNGSTWGNEQKLNPPTEVQYRSFGQGVSVLGDRLLVGATGAGAPGPPSGAAYLYTLKGAQWVEARELVPTDAIPVQGFGFAVSLGPDRALVGAYSDDDACPGEPFCASGSGYIYDINLCLNPIPAVSTWGLVGLGFSVLAVGVLLLRRRGAFGQKGLGRKDAVPNPVKEIGDEKNGCPNRAQDFVVDSGLGGRTDPCTTASGAGAADQTRNGGTPAV